MPEPILRRDRDGPVTRLTLNNPGALNALSDAMLAALGDALTDIATDAETRVVVIAAAGKAFCAGHDLKEMQAARANADGGRAYYDDLFARCGSLMQMIPALPQPVICEVHSIATAAGCQLVASCDMALAAEGTRFGVNGINLGLYCSTPAVALARNVPRKLAFEMAATGDFIDAARAAEIGLINRVVAPENLTDATMALAAQVARKLPVAMHLGKQGFYEQIQLPLDAAYARAGAVMAENMCDPGTAEGVQAFLDKRKPSWAED